MNFFPSPPSSPTPSTFDKVMCGECDKPLASDWFCSDCHKRCEHCNRFLTDEPCSRCWAYDAHQHSYVRKPLRFQPPAFYSYYNPECHQHYYQQQQAHHALASLQRL
ncbi:hypothetical protein [Absidia glauca]|uniref:Uncharacterized protein n=1 Tax=Absidia glauca TaxID=4829 RepID=A0A168QQM6_ABSGL|nr:hypothetical protein [Absidia glauca]